MLNETYAITVNHNVRRTVEVMLNETYAITVNQCRTSWSTLRLFLYATPVRVNLRFEIEITLLGMTVKAVLSVQACPSKLCSEGFKIIINSLMAFKEGAVLECMRYWGEFFPLGGEGMVVVWWRNPPSRGGVGRPRGAAQVGWSWRGDRQQHVRVGWFYLESMLRRLLRVWRASYGP